MIKSFKDLEEKMLVFMDRLPWKKFYKFFCGFILLYAGLSVLYFVGELLKIVPAPQL